RSPGRLLPGLVFGVLHSARLALRLKPFERRTRSSGALLNITRRTLARRLPSTSRSPRIARKLLLERGQTLDDRGFDLEQFFACPERLPACVGANLRAVDGDLTMADTPCGTQPRHALRQQPIKDLHAVAPEVGEP